MLTDYASTGGNEIWNTTRLQAYLTNVGSPFDNGPDICTCDALTPEILGDLGPYTTPSDPASPAPWYDPDMPETGEFLGFLPLSVGGVDDNPRTRNVNNAVGGGGIFGPVRDQPRTMTVSGVLIGTTCCGAEFGLQFLSEALRGCTGDACDGDCFEMFHCCPDPGMTPEQFRARYRRTFRRTALVDGPRVISRSGTGSCSNDGCAGGDLIQVEFILVAANPWAWTDPIPLLDVDLPPAGTGDCLEWCVSTDVTGPNSCDPADCLFIDCATGGDACNDPRTPVPTPPQPTIPEAGFCVPLAPERQCYTLDLSDRPMWSSDVPILTLSAGSSALRNVRITFYEQAADDVRTCGELADDDRCSPHSDFVITYVPAGGTVTIDGQIGRAVIECNGDCRVSSYVFGNQDGGPVRINELSCSKYCVCVEADPVNPPAPDSSLSLSISGKVY